MSVAVVTGAGSGLGRVVARALLGAGWQVVLAGRREELLAETAQAETAQTGAAQTENAQTENAQAGTAESALVVPTDVTSAPSVAALFDTVRDRWGRLDLLVNNAGLFGPAAQPDEIDLADWQRVVDTNLTGAFLCAQHAVRMMKAQHPRGGRIINNGSISAHAPRPNSIAYTATKHAITGLTKSLSLDGRAFGIACGQIDIGNAETELTQRFTRGVLQANGSIAAEPVFDSRHVADAVLYMASLPLDTNVLFLTITATTMPYVGRG
jgi:NAD(P)-dependent dehydrogenase (short-subunit alcohol dehydrogenase family)